MNAKTLAHHIQAELQSASGLDVKRSHVYELIAAAVGCNSHAAMLARGLLCPVPQAISLRQKLHGHLISRRACALGYPPSHADEVGRSVVKAIDQNGLRLLPLDTILSVLIDGQTELFGRDLEADHDTREVRLLAETMDTDEPDLLNEEAWYGREQEEAAAVVELSSEEVVSALELAKDRGDRRAHMAMALLLVDDLEELHEPVSNDGRYWYDREKAGHALQGVELEWADQ